MLGVFLRGANFDSAYQSIHAVPPANLFNGPNFIPSGAPTEWSYEAIRVPSMHEPNSK